MKVTSESADAQPYPTLNDPTDCSPPGSSVHGIFQAGVLEWGAIVILSIEAKKSFYKIPHSFMIETVSTVGMETSMLKTTKHF